MSNEEPEKKNQIRKFVLEHQELFCDPPPEGLGFPRPGMIPGHYLKRPEEWPLDRIRVLRLKREGQLRDGTRNRTVSTGMATATRQLLEDISRLAQEGHIAADISVQMDVTEAGVRNVLALGQGAEDTGALGPVQLPEIELFRNRWGRSWPGGHANGNGHRKSQSAV